MKILELNLVAFGPFTEQSLSFDTDKSTTAKGLHIVYGPNEAGKSSALRGLKALLYGVDERTRDNFIHSNDKLRISGRLGNAQGKEIAFTRRKGRKNTLLMLAGEVLDEQLLLLPFLHGVSVSLFETLFGIDHQALLQGGQEILEQKGEVGQALFSAALGSHVLHAVLDQLDDEANGLFKSSGSKPVINAALKSYAELKRKIKECSLSSREWAKHYRALEKTSDELAKVQSELADNRLEGNRLKRLQRVFPKLARRRELLAEFKSMQGIVLLSDDFAEHHRQVVKELDTARVLLGKSEPRFNSLQSQHEGLLINQELLDEAENIEDFHARLGGHRRASQDRPHLEAQRQQLLTDAEYCLKEIRPDLDLADVEVLRPVLAKRQRITELGNRNAVLVSRAEQAKSNRSDTGKRLKTAGEERDELPEVCSSEALRRAIGAARKLGELDVEIQSAQSEIVTLERQCAADLSRLALWDGDLEDLLGLEVPSREGVIHFEGLYDEIEQRFQHLQGKLDEADSTLQETSLRLDEIQRAGAVPTEKDLLDARSDRDQVWQLLRRQWVAGEDISTEVSQLDVEYALPDVFEDSQINTDELSDRLRREANRVHEMASLQAKQKLAKQQLVELTQQFEACAAERGQIDTEWQTLWMPCEILPRTPREMRVWLDDLGNLCDQIRELNLLRQKTGEREQSRKTHIQFLNQQSELIGKACSKSEALEIVLMECEESVQQLDEIKQKRGLLDKDVKGLEADLESLSDNYQLAMGELDVWTEQWKALIESFGLQGDSSPEEVADFIEKVRELFAKQSEVEKLQIRIKSIDDDAGIFSTQVANMVASVAPEFAKLTTDDAVVRINSLLSDNRSKKTQRQQIEEQLEQIKKEIEDSQSVIETKNDQLDSLCVESQCNKYEELEAAECKSAKYLGIKTAIVTIEEEILTVAEGATVAELVVETEGIDPDGLPGQIEALSNKIDD